MTPKATTRRPRSHPQKRPARPPDRRTCEGSERDHPLLGIPAKGLRAGLRRDPTDDDGAVRVDATGRAGDRRHSRKTAERDRPTHRIPTERVPQALTDDDGSVERAVFRPEGLRPFR